MILSEPLTEIFLNIFEKECDFMKPEYLPNEEHSFLTIEAMYITVEILISYRITAQTEFAETRLTPEENTIQVTDKKVEEILIWTEDDSVEIPEGVLLQLTNIVNSKL